MNIPRRRIYCADGRLYMPQILREDRGYWEDAAGKVFYSREEANAALNWYLCMMWDYYLHNGDSSKARDKLPNGRNW